MVYIILYSPPHNGHLQKIKLQTRQTLNVSFTMKYKIRNQFSCNLQTIVSGT